MRGQRLSVINLDQWIKNRKVKINNISWLDCLENKGIGHGSGKDARLVVGLGCWS
jgi:hypothetical protein